MNYNIEGSFDKILKNETEKHQKIIWKIEFQPNLKRFEQKLAFEATKRSTQKLNALQKFCRTNFKF